MRFIQALGILLLYFFCTADVGAQNGETDSLRMDTVRNKFFPTGIRFGTDMIHLVKTQFQDDFDGWEVAADIDFDRYYLALEYGRLGRNLNSDSAAYANKGTFWRAGVDVNFLTNDPDRNMFFLGARYGRAVFSESMTMQAFDPIWGSQTSSFYHSGVNAWWLELTTGLRVKMWKIFWFGYTGRLKFALSSDGTEEMLPHDIPGFGKTDRETTWGFNYYLMIRIPIRKAPPPPPKKD